MNQFKLLNTSILKSELDFTKAKSSLEFSGSANLSASISIPKDLEKNKIIHCILQLLIGGAEQKIRIFIKTVSVFEIETLENAEELRKDAQNICLPKATEEMSLKIQELTRLHTGTALQISLPSLTE